MKKRLLLTSILSIVMCFSLICGATFALFTSESKVNIAVTSGTVSVTANVGTVETGSTLGDEFVQYEYLDGVYNVSTMVAGDYIKFPVSITSDSDVDIMYRVRTALSGELAQEVDVVIENASGVMGNNAMTSWIAHNANVASVDDYTITISLDKDNKTANGGKELKIQLLVEAVQGNAVSSTPTNATQLENALNYGGVVTLGADIVLDKPIVVNADAVATLDFAGKTISTSSNFAGTHAIENNGTLTLINSGNAGGSGASGYASERAMVSTFAVRFEETANEPKVGGIESSVGVILNNGSLTIEGGKYTAESGAIITVEENAEVTVENGTFSAINGADVINVKEESSQVEINGGSFSATVEDNSSATAGAIITGAGSVEINNVEEIVGTIVEENSSSNVIIDSNVNLGEDTVLPEGVKTKVSSTEELKNVLANDKEIILTAGTYALPSLYNYTGVVLVGEGEVVISTGSVGFGSNFGKDNTYKNLKFHGTSNGVRWSYGNGGTVVFDDCQFMGDSTYGFHIDQSNGADFIFNNCTFSGFNAFAGDLNSITFNSCTFLHNGNYGHTNIWSVAYYNNCVFGENTSYSGKVYMNGALLVETTEELTTAIKNGETKVLLADGNYSMPDGGDISLRGKTLAISGSRNAIIDATNVDERDQFVTGATLSFIGVTLNFGTVNYMGFANATLLKYENCAINGLQFLYGPNVEFVGCDLNSNGAEHCVWTWGVQNVSFTDCNFTYGDRAINCYGEGVATVASFTNCEFTKVEGKEVSGAIETNSSTLASLTLNIEKCSVNEGDLWWVSEWDSKNGANTTTTVK